MPVSSRSLVCDACGHVHTIEVERRGESVETVNGPIPLRCRACLHPGLTEQRVSVAIGGSGAVSVKIR